jgi:hypothetical protein
MQNPEINPSAKLLNDLVTRYIEANPPSEEYQKALEDPFRLLELGEEERDALLTESDPTRIIGNAVRESDLNDEAKIDVLLEALRQSQEAAAELVKAAAHAATHAADADQQRMAATMAAIIAKFGPITLTVAESVQSAKDAERVTSVIDEAAGTLTYSLRPVVPGADTVQ